MLPALISALAPLAVQTIKNFLKEKAPKEVQDFISQLEKDEKLQKELQKQMTQTLIQYNEQILKEIEIRERYKNINKVSQLVRPTLTFAITEMFNVAMLVGLFTGKVSFQEYLTTLAPVNSMLLGFWFGERSALKDPRKALMED